MIKVINLFLFWKKNGPSADICLSWEANLQKFATYESFELKYRGLTQVYRSKTELNLLFLFDCQYPKLAMLSICVLSKNVGEYEN